MRRQLERACRCSSTWSRSLCALAASGSSLRQAPDDGVPRSPRPGSRLSSCTWWIFWPLAGRRCAGSPGSRLFTTTLRSRFSPVKRPSGGAAASSGQQQRSSVSWGICGSTGAICSSLTGEQLLPAVDVVGRADEGCVVESASAFGTPPTWFTITDAGAAPTILFSIAYLVGAHDE